MIAKGEIIRIDGWGGVIGRFERYDSTTKSLFLSWPKKVYWGKEEQYFQPVELSDIKVLNAEEVFEELLALMDSWQKTQAQIAADGAADGARSAFGKNLAPLFGL